MQSLRILANEYGIIELLDEFNRKNGSYDDLSGEHASRLRLYKSNLEALERKFIQIAGSHYDL